MGFILHFHLLPKIMSSLMEHQFLFFWYGELLIHRPAILKKRYACARKIASYSCMHISWNKAFFQDSEETQGPIHEIFMKKCWELVELENEFFFFLSRPFWFFFSKNFFLLHLNENKQPVHLFLHYGWFLQNLHPN